LVHLTHLFHHWIWLPQFPNPWKEVKVITLPKPGKDPKFLQNLYPISLLSTTGKLFKKVILKFVQKHVEEWGLLNASQFGFRECQSKTLQCLRLTDHVTLNFNNKMSTAAVFLDIEKAVDTTWHSGLLYKLSKLEFSANFINSFWRVVTMVNNTRNFSVSGLYPSSGVWRNTTFRKLDLFPSSGKRGGEDTYSVGPLRKS
jgi:hypothetical protein